jgi:acid phosphatase (class A)
MFADKDSSRVIICATMSTLSRRAALAVLCALLLSTVASASPPYYYLDPQQIDLTTLLPPPPDASSAQERTDEQQVAAAVAARSPAQVSEAEADSMRSVFFFAQSIGPQFEAAKLPMTARFFSHIRSDVEQLVDRAKAYWDRPRPNGTRKTRGSYPSGHAAFAAATAIVLSQLIPSERDAIFAQARIFAENRIILGVHYPSDVAAGWTAGTLAAYAMMRNRTFRQDFSAVNAELRAANL